MPDIITLHQSKRLHLTEPVLSLRRLFTICGMLFSLFRWEQSNLEEKRTTGQEKASGDTDRPQGFMIEMLQNRRRQSLMLCLANPGYRGDVAEQ